jgi:hypothetical protein
MASTFKATIHMGAAGREARHDAMVCTLQPWVSWICRDRQSTTGATIHAQKTCQKIEGHL